jgi:hypothetical protein
MTATTLPPPATHWSSASHDTGWQDTPTNRAAIRAASAAIDWTDRPATVQRLHHATVRVLMAAIFFGRLDQLHEAGSAAVALDGERHALIGLADDRNRYYLLDLGHEAVYVLHESRNA